VAGVLPVGARHCRTPTQNHQLPIALIIESAIAQLEPTGHPTTAKVATSPEFAQMPVDTPPHCHCSFVSSTTNPSGYSKRIPYGLLWHNSCIGGDPFNVKSQSRALSLTQWTKTFIQSALADFRF